MAATEHFITFHVGGLFCGIKAVQVQELTTRREMTPVPLAPAEIEGLINLRGEIVTAIDLRRRLALAPRPTEQPPMNVVIRAEGGPVSLLVDEIGDVMEISEDTLEPPPETVRGVARELVRGVCQLPGCLLLVLDVGKTLELPTARTSVTTASNQTPL